MINYGNNNNNNFIIINYSSLSVFVPFSLSLFPPSPLFPLFLSSFFSAYNRSYQYNLLDEYHDSKATSEVYKAMLLLTLAMVAKAVLTIFTFGIKVS